MEKNGYIIIGIFLFSIIIILLALIIYLGIKLNDPKTGCPSSFGQFGIMPNLDNIVINKCGTNGTSPCTFNVSTVAGAIDKCNTLASVCNTFSFNESRKEMKIIGLTGAYANNLTDLYSRN